MAFPFLVLSPTRIPCLPFLIYTISVIPPHTLHEENSQNLSNAICFNWTSFFGGKERTFPSCDDWNSILLKQLEETRKWIISADRPRRISLTGNRRLSASLATGSVFSSVGGFVIEMETRDGLWKTNSYPTSDTPDYSWSEYFIEGQPNHEMALAISIMRDIRLDVGSYIKTMGLDAPCLYLNGENPIISDKQTNVAVEKVKKILLNKIAIYHLNKIHLFFSGPAHLALFLGHRLNSTCHIQCYEYNVQHDYVKTCLLKF